MRTSMYIRGMDIETKMRLKMMAANKGIPIHKLVDLLVEDYWKKKKIKWLPVYFLVRCVNSLKSYWANYERTGGEALIFLGC